jgi:hypothetical protein
MLTIRDRITEKLQELPDYSLSEVLDFVEFLTWKRRNEKQPISVPEEDPILSVLGILDGEPLTNEQIDDELYGFYSNRETASGE